MTFKLLQRLRIASTGVRNTLGHPVKQGTRVVVVNIKDGKVTARLGGRGSARVIAAPDAFEMTHRGRPKTA
jgi:hypothetical protein